jgi:hypothetical protein
MRGCIFNVVEVVSKATNDKTRNDKTRNDLYKRHDKTRLAYSSAPSSHSEVGALFVCVIALSSFNLQSGRGRPDLVQPITKVRVRHHQVDQPAVLGTRCTRHAQRARVSGADGALGLRLRPTLDHQDPSESSSCCPTRLRDLRIPEHLFDNLEMTERPRLALREPRSLAPEQMGQLTVSTSAAPQPVHAWILWEDGVEELIDAQVVAWTGRTVRFRFGGPAHHQGACSRHGGVKVFYSQSPFGTAETRSTSHRADVLRMPMS